MRTTQTSTTFVWMGGCLLLGVMSHPEAHAACQNPPEVTATCFTSAQAAGRPLCNDAGSLPTGAMMSPPVCGLPLETMLGTSNGYGAFNVIGNHMHHTGIDMGLPGAEDFQKLPVRAAVSGRVSVIIGLVPDGGGEECLQTWDDAAGQVPTIPECQELSGNLATGRTRDGQGNRLDNHAFGTSIIIDHGNGLYSQYSHLSAVTKILWEAFLAVDRGQACPMPAGRCPLDVDKGDLIALVGASGDDNPITWWDAAKAWYPHLHFEVKQGLKIGSPQTEGTVRSWGYTPDFPDAYGYHDPLRYFYPSFAVEPTGKRPVEVVAEEGGSSVPDRGIRLYTGPGIGYSVIGWTGLNQRFFVTGSRRSTQPSDPMPDRLWYRVSLPNRMRWDTSSPVVGWMAAQSSAGAALVQPRDEAEALEVIDDQGRGWGLSRQAGTDCTSTSTEGSSQCVRVFDNVPTPDVHRNVRVWNDLRMIRASSVVAEKVWHQVEIPKRYFVNPNAETSCASPPSQDQCVGEIETAWLPDEAVMGVPGTPAPADGARMETRPVALDWADAVGATAYDVYLDGSFVGRVTQSEWALNQSLIPGAHRWVVIARKGTSGSSIGPLWTFTIGPPACVEGLTTRAVEGRETLVTAAACGHTLDITTAAGGSPATVSSGGTVNMSVTAEDSLGHPLSYQWTASCPTLPSNGSFDSATARTPTWTAPTNTTGSQQDCAIAVTVSDGQGLSQPSAYTQHVTSTNHAITLVTPATGVPNPILPGGVANLNVVAQDSLGHPLSYVWTASCPTLASHGTLVGTATPNPTWQAPQNATGGTQTCQMQVTISDGLGVSVPSGYSHSVSPGGVTSLSIASGVRFQEPPPYDSEDRPTVEATIKNVGSATLLIDRIQALISLKDPNGNFPYERDTAADQFAPPLSLSPGQSYTYASQLTSTLGGGSLGYLGTVAIYVKFNGIAGQNPITRAESGASAQWVFQKSHLVEMPNAPGTGTDPVASGGVALFGVSGARDSFFHPLVYAWIVSCPTLPSNGNLDATTPWRPAWTAPVNRTGSEQSCAVTLTVGDGFGLSAQGSFTQRVSSVAAHTLTVTSPADGWPNPIGPGGAVETTVTAVDSLDHALTYFWSDSCPSLPSAGTFNNATLRTPIWTAPTNLTGSAADCTLTVRIDDGHALQRSSDYDQTVDSFPDAITIVTPASGTPNPVAAGGSVALSVAAVDLLDHALTYRWKTSCPGLASSGAFDNAILRTPIWTAPVNQTGSAQSCMLTVTVEDDHGQQAQSGVEQILNVSTPLPPRLQGMVTASGGSLTGLTKRVWCMIGVPAVGVSTGPTNTLSLGLLGEEVSAP